MLKGKAPAFQFYVKDWLCDPQLRMCSHTTKGIWIDLLCLMWEAPERGKLTGTIDQFCKMLSSQNGDFEQFLNDVKSTKFANVTFCNIDITIENRRMLRDEKIKYNTKLRVQKHRRKAPCNENVTTPSSSSSSIIKKYNKKKDDVTLPEWLDFDLWKEFLEHRKKLRKPMTNYAQNLMLKKLTWMKEKGYNPEHLLKDAMVKGYQDVFEPKT